MTDTKQRFYRNVRKQPGDGCWLWLGWLDEQGRGRFRLDGRSVTSSRAAWILEHGAIVPETLEVMHVVCDNPQCVRVDHFKLGTRADNMRDMAAKGRSGPQRYPWKYKRPRSPGTRYRPLKQHGTPKGIDSRTWTRYAVDDEMRLAKRALELLQAHHNRIALVPAPHQSHASQKIRVQEEANPDWYRQFGQSYWRGPRCFCLKRSRVERALKRVVAGRVRGNGYEQEILEFLRENRDLLGLSNADAVAVGS